MVTIHVEEDIGDFPLEPFQLRHIAFPHHSFGITRPVSRSFQATWSSKFAGWLHYDLEKDAARCFTCCKAVKDGRALSDYWSNRQSIHGNGFTNWKDATHAQK